ncbi:MAG: hypothetical protein NT027_00545 [Proteobacteria bacterium]|nr:hypothetical protein [Pseudomonadota bacterium]
MRNNLAFLLLFFTIGLNGNSAFSGVTIEPYVSVSSTKQVKPEKAGQNKSKPATTETEVIKQRTTVGLRGSIGFFRIFKFQLGVGQNELTTTSKTNQAVDDYGEIDFEKDMSMDTSNPDKEVKIVETQRKGAASVVLDPSFSVFILRAKAGVVATQREFKKEEVDKPVVSLVTQIKYKPTVGAGAGVKFGPRMYFLAEYSLFLYKFPEKSPFERELTVSYGVTL